MRSNIESDGRERSTFLGDARRAQFIECAIDALAESGFAGASIAQVAKRAGVSKSVVLYHFASKSALMEAVVIDVYTGAVPAMVAALAAAPNERERLAAYIRGCTDFAWTHQKELRAVSEVFRNLRRDDGERRYTAKDSAELIEGARNLLVAGQESGEFGDFDAHTLSIVLRAAVDALPGIFESDPSARGPEVAEHLVRIFDAAVRP